MAGSPTVRCHVECKNLDRPVTVDDIAGKLAQQKYHHRGIQIDHWILISPHHDVANELPGMLDALGPAERISLLRPGLEPGDAGPRDVRPGARGL